MSPETSTEGRNPRHEVSAVARMYYPSILQPKIALVMSPIVTRVSSPLSRVNLPDGPHRAEANASPSPRPLCKRSTCLAKADGGRSRLAFAIASVHCESSPGSSTPGTVRDSTESPHLSRASWRFRQWQPIHLTPAMSRNDSLHLQSPSKVSMPDIRPFSTKITRSASRTVESR